MNVIKVNINGKEYLIKDNDAQILIKELLNRIEELENKAVGAEDLVAFNDDNIFVGIMDETDKDKPITYSYLTSLLSKDQINNKVFNNSDLPITIRHKWLAGGEEPLKTFFILVPTSHKNLYSIGNGFQCFTGWDDDYTVVTIDFPSGAKQYKLFRFCNWLVRCNSEITYKF